MTIPVISAADERLLVLAPTGRDGPLTQALLRKAGLPCDVCVDMDDLCHRLENEGAGALLMAMEVLGRAESVKLRATLSGQPSWSDIPILLFSGETTHPRRPEALTNLLDVLGNVTLLDRPLRPITMVSAAKAALRARHRQYEARDELVRQARAVQARDEFLAMLGHELRNPLSAIAMAIEMMERAPGGDLQKPRAIVRRQARHLARLVDDLLDVSRVSSGKIVLKRAPVDFGELVERCLQSVGAAVKTQRLEMNFSRVPTALVVDGDSVRLEQIVMNLVTNAIKYTPPGGHIDIHVESAEGGAVLRVKDDGSGITSDMLPRIFELFAQAEATLERSKGGMGIGLTLVRTLLELHGGTIEAESAGLGKGSTFTARLPLRQTVDSPAESPPESSRISVSISHSVLIVEDNDDSRELLQSYLSQAGHRVDAVGDGLKGVDRAVEVKPKVVIVDIGLPSLDGYGVARRVREYLGASPFLIALTGYGQPEDRRLALEAGFDLHFTKPIDLGGLKRLLSQPDLRR
jgi:signal transduction histidine kinase